MSNICIEKAVSTGDFYIFENWLFDELSCTDLTQEHLNLSSHGDYFDKNLWQISMAFLNSYDSHLSIK